jgi:WD40 repeat protein
MIITSGFLAISPSYDAHIRIADFESKIRGKDMLQSSPSVLRVLCILCGLQAVAGAAPPDYATDVAPLLAKYCTACHGAEEPEGKLVLESYATLMAGGANGGVIVPGRAAESRLVRMLTGEAKPQMPPDDNERPKPAEIEIIKQWIDAGAKSPEGKQPDPTLLVTPRIAPRAEVKRKITAVAVSPDGSLLAIARLRDVELIKPGDGSMVRTLADHHGSVNAVNFSTDGSQLVVASGEPGLFGEATLWNVADGPAVRKFRGHRDTLYAARLSPDGKLLATGSYDQRILLWDTQSGSTVRTIAGHNGAVLDLDFSPDGKLLASASGDRTVKLWDVASGARLDTLGQPLRDVYTAAFSPDGKFLAAGGVDRRIRIWSIIAGGKEGTNTLVHTRFAHDGAILRLVWSRDGKSLVSSADNRTIKVWDAAEMSPRQMLETQPDWATGLALSSDGRTLFIGRMDGSFATQQVAGASPSGDSLVKAAPALAPAEPSPPEPMVEIAEVEPNDAAPQATAINLPAVVAGKLLAGSGQTSDADIFRYQAKAGETWILETSAARSGSRADTKLEVLSTDGKPVLRMMLEATRDSAVTFRGADSNATGFRLMNSEEMELNQYLYVGGEVCRLFRFPQGPDSDFVFYDASGRRRGYFDTTPTTHYLDEPCYIVRPVPPGEKTLASGLPVFPLYFVNDDDGLRRLGADSRLTFVAPADGEYLVRVTDSRGLSSDKSHYKLTLRKPRHDFKVSLAEVNASVHAGSGRRFTVRVDRVDGFDDEVRIDVAGLPPGFSTSGPLVVEAGHDACRGTLYAAAGAPAPTKENATASTLTATATIDGKPVTKAAGGFGELKLAPKPKLIVRLELDPANKSAAPPSQSALPELTIAPGTMVSAKLRVERNGFDGEIKFDVDNLPHGVIVDDIGLNGILILPGQTERQIFLTARPWVPENTRPFHALALVEGNQASPPMMLRVKKP